MQLPAPDSSSPSSSPARRGAAAGSSSQGARRWGWGWGGGASGTRGGRTGNGRAGSGRGSSSAGQPRTSWRHRKQVEVDGRSEGLPEWQLNAYYCAGRVVVPALLDTFTLQAVFKGRRLVELLTELAGWGQFGVSHEAWGHCLWVWGSEVRWRTILASNGLSAIVHSRVIERMSKRLPPFEM